MANRGWDGMNGGDAMPSNARTTGRVSGTDDAEQFVRPAATGVPDSAGDTLDARGDLHSWSTGS